MITAQRFFRIAYCGFLVLGIFAYADGYEYYLNLTGRAGMAKFVHQIGCLAVMFLMASMIWTSQRWTVWAALIFFSLHEILVSPELRPYSTNLAFPVLALLAVTDQPLRSVTRVTALYYTISGLTKILWGGTAWWTGATLELYLREAQMIYGPDWAWSVLLSSPLLLAISSSFIALWEASFLLALRSSLLARFYVASALVFHFMVYLIFGANFFLFVAPALISFWPQIRSHRTKPERAA